MLLITLLFIVVNDVFLNFDINKMYLSRSGQEQVRRWVGRRARHVVRSQQHHGRLLQQLVRLRSQGVGPSLSTREVSNTVFYLFLFFTLCLLILHYLLWTITTTTRINTIRLTQGIFSISPLCTFYSFFSLFFPVIPFIALSSSIFLLLSLTNTTVSQIFVQSEL